MRLTQKAVLAGLASLALAGAALAAETPSIHTMNIHLPDGAVAHVRYSGDVPPTVTVDQGQAPGRFDPANVFAGFDPAPFAALDRMAAAMDREAEAMLRQARLGAPASGLGEPGLDLLAAGGLPAGTIGYSYVSESTSNGSCTRSVEVTRPAPGAKPNIVTHQNGDCGAGPAAAKPDLPAAPAPGTSAGVKPVKPAAPAAAASATI